MSGQKWISYVENVKIKDYKECLDERAINTLESKQKFMKKLKAFGLAPEGWQ